MSTQHSQKSYPVAQAVPLSRSTRFGLWVQDPLGSVIVASVATIGAFLLVLSGVFFVNLVVN